MDEMYEIEFQDGVELYSVFHYSSKSEAVAWAEDMADYGEELAIFSETGELIAKSDGYKLSKERALKSIAAHIDAIQEVAAVFGLDKAVSIAVFKDSAFAFMLDDEGNSVFDIGKYGGEWGGL
jgi:hypothetical protein